MTRVKVLHKQTSQFNCRFESSQFYNPRDEVKPFIRYER